MKKITVMAGCVMLSALLAASADAGDAASAAQKNTTQAAVSGTATGTAAGKTGTSIVERDRRRHDVKRRAEAKRNAELRKAANKSKKQGATADKTAQPEVPAAAK